jgi:hypothetical protein
MIVWPAKYRKNMWTPNLTVSINQQFVEIAVTNQFLELAGNRSRLWKIEFLEIVLSIGL